MDGDVGRWRLPSLEALLTVEDHISIPQALRASVDRYRANMTRMAQSLRMASLSEAQIEQGMQALAASYRAELAKAMEYLQDASMQDTGVPLV